MACLHPIYIKNPHVFGKNVRASEVLAAEPWELGRLSFAVPCGKCVECLRAARNEWFVRLSQEFAYQRLLGIEPIWITITVNPKYYESAMDNPPGFIRRIFENIRRRTGSSIKHALFSEYCPSSGRVHFHGFLFGTTLRFNYLRELFAPFGFVWLSAGNLRLARYSLKYAVKDVGQIPEPRDAAHARRLRRKCISAGVGAYLGCRPAPSYSISTWSFRDCSTGRTYKYRIPRYYDKFAGAAFLAVRSVRSCLVNATLRGLSDIVEVARRRIVEICGEYQAKQALERAAYTANRLAAASAFSEASPLSFNAHALITNVLISLNLDFSWLRPPKLAMS